MLGEDEILTNMRAPIDRKTANAIDPSIVLQDPGHLFLPYRLPIIDALDNKRVTVQICFPKKKYKLFHTIESPRPKVKIPERFAKIKVL